MGIVYYSFLPRKHDISVINGTPTTSLEETICKEISTQFDKCKRILLYDPDLSLVFVEGSSGIIPVLTNKDFTAFKQFIYPILDFQEFKEEKVERGLISWQVSENIQHNYSIIYGFAEDAVKTIVINSEGNIQPNRFFVKDNLWVWYVVVQKNHVQLPVEATVYDEGQRIEKD